jgi:hypothetical protein
MTPPVYVDTSVLVAALTRDDTHHEQARKWFAEIGLGFVTSVITDVELERALARRGVPARSHRMADRTLASAQRLDVTADIRATAASLAPASLRSLDAIHVATALTAEVAWFATFDVRQAVGAEEAGLVLSR